MILGIYYRVAVGTKGTTFVNTTTSSDMIVGVSITGCVSVPTHVMGVYLGVDVIDVAYV